MMLTRRTTLGMMLALAACTKTASRAPSEGRIAVPGGNVAWRRFGTGGSKTPLLLIHGGPGLTGNYMEGLDALGDERPAFIWDQLECGRSDRSNDKTLWTLARFVEELDVVRNELAPGPVHVLGHSWGTTLAMEWLVTKRPTDVASVTFLGPALSTPRWIEDMRELIASLSPASQAAIADAERTGDFGSPGYQAASGEWMTAHIVRTLEPGQLESLVGSLEKWNANLEILEYMWGPSDFTVTGTLKSFDRTGDLHSLTMPVLFSCGEFDEARPATVREQAALTPRAEIVVVPGAGHLTMIDAPQVLNAAIRDFLSRTAAG